MTHSGGIQKPVGCGVCSTSNHGEDWADCGEIHREMPEFAWGSQDGYRDGQEARGEGEDLEIHQQLIFISNHLS